MALNLVDFSDIYTAVIEMAKIQASDVTTVNRIKRHINMAYINEVVPFHNWDWLYKDHVAQIAAAHTTGTMAVTKGSTTITSSAVIAESKAGHTFRVSGQRESYRISSHTAGTDTLVLDIAYADDTNSAMGYAIWNEYIDLPTDCREVVMVYTEDRAQELEGKGKQELQHIMLAFNSAEDVPPQYYTVDDFYDPTPLDDETESDRYRRLRLFPTLSSDITTVRIVYVQEVEALDLDADEPVMPIEDRVVLYYKGLEFAWSLERNPEEAMRNKAEYGAKMTRMRSKMKTNDDHPRIQVSRLYLSSKRRRNRRTRNSWGNW